MIISDRLKENPNSRIVNVSSLAGKTVRKFDTKNLNHYPEDIFNSNMEVYGRSKLCNILFTIELSNRLKGTSVTAYSLHPGVVATDIFRTMPPLMKTVVETVISWFFKVIGSRFHFF